QIRIAGRVEVTAFLEDPAGAVTRYCPMVFYHRARTIRENPGPLRIDPRRKWRVFERRNIDALDGEARAAIWCVLQRRVRRRRAFMNGLDLPLRDYAGCNQANCPQNSHRAHLCDCCQPPTAQRAKSTKNRVNPRPPVWSRPRLDAGNRAYCLTVKLSTLFTRVVA